MISFLIYKMIKNNFSNKISKLNNSRAQALPLNTIVIAILVVIVMVVVIVMFNSGTGEAQKDLDNLGDSFSGCNDRNTLYSNYDVVKPMLKSECKSDDKDGTVLMSPVEDKDKICCGYSLKDKKEEVKVEETKEP